MSTDTNGSIVNFAWKHTVSYVPELLSDGINDYVYGPQGTAPIEQVNESTGAATYLYTDQLGSVTMEADSSGNVTGTQSYSPYGTVSSTTGTWTTPFGFAGGYTDETGLVYLIHRYYDSNAGQFVSVDPLGAISDAPYSYGSNNPIQNTDPEGLITIGSYPQCYEHGVDCPPPPPPSCGCNDAGAKALSWLGILVGGICLGVSVVDGESTAPACVIGTFAITGATATSEYMTYGSCALGSIAVSAGVSIAGDKFLGVGSGTMGTGVYGALPGAPHCCKKG